MFSVFRGYQPDWLYKKLPYLYISAGVLTILVLRNAMAFFSGFMLISAGMIVWSIRNKYRETLPSASVSNENNSDQLIHVIWRQSFNSGLIIIDNQHRSLFTKANELIDAITNHHPNLVINTTMRELIKDIQYHFKTEEEILEKLAPSIVASHKEIHAQLLEETRTIADRVLNKDATPRELIGFLVFDVISNHLIREDSEFFPVIKSVG
jgi:hemerythrin-like metal-binding protein